MAWARKRGNRWHGKYRDAEGKERLAGTATTKKEAMQLAVQKELEVESGDWTDPKAGKMPYWTYFEVHWFPNKVAEHNTMKKHRSHYDSSIRAYFGDMELCKITPAHVQRWVVQMQKEGLKPSTIESKFMSLQTVLAGTKGVSALRDGLIRRNPCEGVTLPTIPPREVQTYSVEEASRLMEALPEKLRWPVLLSVESGMRWGELMGLEVGDFSPDFRQVLMRRTILESTTADFGGTRFKVKEYPKGKHWRKIALDDNVAEALQELVRRRKLFPGDRLFSEIDGDGMPIRTKEWPNGLPISRSAQRYHWLKVHRELRIKARKFHALRGSHISWLLAGGADIATVMDRVGHRKMSTTQVYVAAMEDAPLRALEALRATKMRHTARREGLA